VEIKLCPIRRTFLFLSDEWESVELRDDLFLFKICGAVDGAVSVLQ